MIRLKKHGFLALTYFVLIATLGVLLRLFPIVDIPTSYKFLIHTHSHVALLGWVYTALTTLIYKIYLENSQIERRYRFLFWGTQITIIGMLLTFPFTGYALLSITFSTLFLIASYLFTWLFIKHASSTLKQTNAYRCILAALWYMVISSIGPWALGIIMNTLGSGSDLYRSAIYFYLHFQYNGWFILALFGIFFYLLELHAITIPKKVFNYFFLLMNIGVVATFGISLLWMQPSLVIYLFSATGAFFQLLAVGILIKYLLSRIKQHHNSTNIFSVFLKIIFVFFSIKLIVQLLGSTPYFANMTSNNINLIIAYLHWVFLGIISPSLLLLLHYFKLINLSIKALNIYILAFILTECFIIYKGIVIWLQVDLISYYYEYLIGVSCLLLVAILNIYRIQFKKEKKHVIDRDKHYTAI